MPEAGDNALLAEIRDLMRQLVAKASAGPQRLMRVKQTAKYLGVSVGQVHGMIARGDLPLVEVHDANGHSPMMVDVRDADALIEKLKLRKSHGM